MLSIIMPVYNAFKYLETAVSSVLDQTYQKFELILVDDGSSDGSGELCETLALVDSRVRVIHQKNKGVAAARNAGLDAARGEYIGWVDSDDLVHSEMFEIMLAHMEHHGADIVQCSHTRDPEQMDKKTGNIEILGNIDSLKRIYRSHYTNACALWSKVYRAELFEGIRFAEGTAFEDDEIVPLLLECSPKTVFFEAKLYCYMKRESSIVTAPKVENIVALTTHLVNRMMRFESLNEELYNMAREHLFAYLKGKICERVFWNTQVQNQAVEQLKKHRKRFWKHANRYDRVAMILLACGGVKIVARSGFKPVQKIIRRIKGCS